MVGGLWGQVGFGALVGHWGQPDPVCSLTGCSSQDARSIQRCMSLALDQTRRYLTPLLFRKGNPTSAKPGFAHNSLSAQESIEAGLAY